MIIRSTEDFIKYIEVLSIHSNSSLYKLEAKSDNNIINNIVKFNIVVEYFDKNKIQPFDLIHKSVMCEHNNSDKDYKLIKKQIENIISNENFSKIIVND